MPTFQNVSDVNNLSSSSSTETDQEDGEDGQNWTYGIIYTYYYTVWSNLIVTTIIPLAVLIFCNVGIFLTLRRSRQSIITAARVDAQSHFSSTRQRNENGLALILIAIVLVFLVCHACRFFLAFYRVSQHQTDKTNHASAAQNECMRMHG